MKKQALILFLRAPEKGRVKTRLSARLNEVFVLNLYKAFVLDILDTVSSFKHYFLFYWPPDKKEMVETWLGSPHRYHQQQGNNIGSKMAHAFETVFRQGYDEAILIGTDIPELSRKIIQEAFLQFNGYSTVIGPSLDGGYYLIGMKKESFSKSVFENIDWSSSKVLEQTCHKLVQCGNSYALVETLDDIDTPEDLDALKTRIVNGTLVGNNTKKTIEQDAC